MENPELVQSVTDLWSKFISVDGFACFVGFVAIGGLILGFLITSLIYLVEDVFTVVHEASPYFKRLFRDKRRKQSGKLTNEQRLELLEERIDSLADIVISSSEEVK